MADCCVTEKLSASFCTEFCYCFDCCLGVFVDVSQLLFWTGFIKLFTFH
jgi:hypothetical protein